MGAVGIEEWVSDGLEDSQVEDRRMEKLVDRWADGSVETR